MQNQSKKYASIFLLWILLFCCAILILKLTPTTSSSNLIDRKLLDKKTDTAIKKLNMSMPTQRMYQDLLNANVNDTVILKSPELIDYYEQLIDIMPWMPEAYSLLGFCYYKSGNKEKAYNLFKRAISLDPNSFYNHLNLGLMYLEANQLSNGMTFMQMALNLAPQHTLQAMTSSKIYQDIFMANPDYNPVNELQKNYDNLTKLLKNLKSPTQQLNHDQIQLRVL